MRAHVLAMKRAELVNWVSREEVTRGSIDEDAASVWFIGVALSFQISR